MSCPREEGPGRGPGRQRHRARCLERHHAVGPQRVHLLGRGRRAGDHAGPPHSADAGGARGRHEALLLAGVQAPRAPRANSRCVAARRHRLTARFTTHQLLANRPVVHYACGDPEAASTWPDRTARPLGGGAFAAGRPRLGRDGAVPGRARPARRARALGWRLAGRRLGVRGGATARRPPLRGPGQLRAARGRGVARPHGRESRVPRHRPPSRRAAAARPRRRQRPASRPGSGPGCGSGLLMPCLALRLSGLTYQHHRGQTHDPLRGGSRLAVTIQPLSGLIRGCERTPIPGLGGLARCAASASGDTRATGRSSRRCSGDCPTTPLCPLQDRPARAVSGVPAG